MNKMISFSKSPGVEDVARCYVCELVPGLENAMLDFTGVYIYIFIHIYIYIYTYIYIYINK